MNRRRAFWLAQARAQRRAVRSYEAALERHQRRWRTLRRQPGAVALAAMGGAVFLAVVAGGVILILPG